MRVMDLEQVVFATIRAPGTELVVNSEFDNRADCSGQVVQAWSVPLLS
jgi:hypothetical protein